MFEIEDEDPSLADSMRRRAGAAVTGFYRRLTPGSSLPPSVPFFVNLLPDAELWPKTGRVGEQRLLLVQYWRQMQREIQPDAGAADGAVEPVAASPELVAAPAENLTGPIRLPASSGVLDSRAPVSNTAPAEAAPAARARPSLFSSQFPSFADLHDDDQDDGVVTPAAAPAAEPAVARSAEAEPVIAEPPAAAPAVGPDSTWVPASVLFRKSPEPVEAAVSIPDSVPPVAEPIGSAEPVVRTEPLVRPTEAGDAAPLVRDEPTEEPIVAAEADVAPRLVAAQPVVAEPIEPIAEVTPDVSGIDIARAAGAGADVIPELAETDLPEPDVAAMAIDVLVEAPIPVAAELQAELSSEGLDELSAQLLAGSHADLLPADFSAPEPAIDDFHLAESLAELPIEGMSVVQDVVPAEPIEIEAATLFADAVALPEPEIGANVLDEHAPDLVVTFDQAAAEIEPVEMPALVAEATAEPVELEPEMFAPEEALPAAVDEDAGEFVAAIEAADLEIPVPDVDLVPEPVHDAAPIEVVLPVPAPAAAFPQPLSAESPAEEAHVEESWDQVEFPAPAPAAHFDVPLTRDAVVDDAADETWEDVALPVAATQSAFAPPQTEMAASDAVAEPAGEADELEHAVPVAATSFVAPVPADESVDDHTDDVTVLVELPAPSPGTVFAVPLTAQAADHSDDDEEHRTESLEPVAADLSFADSMAAGLDTAKPGEPATDAAPARRDAHPMPALEADPVWHDAVSEWTVDARDARLRRAGVIPMPTSKPAPVVTAPVRSAIPALERFLRSAQARRRKVAAESVA